MSIGRLAVFVSWLVFFYFFMIIVWGVVVQGVIRGWVVVYFLEWIRERQRG